MIAIINAIILGIVEGVTEFLPISSTGHLILVNQWISFAQPFTLLFDIVIQLGAILAVVVYFWNRLWPFNKEETEKKKVFAIWVRAIVGVIPAIILGFLFANKIEQTLFNPLTVAITLFLGGVILIFIEKKSLPVRFSNVSELPFTTVIYIGLIQSLAMVPGVSRSGATIIGAMLLGVSRMAAVEFSFFLAIPTMIAASGYSVLKYGFSMTTSEAGILTVGFIVSFLVALLVIKFFISYIQKHNFVAFGYYRIILAILVLIFLVF